MPNIVDRLRTSPDDGRGGGGPSLGDSGGLSDDLAGEDGGISGGIEGCEARAGGGEDPDGGATPIIVLPRFIGATAGGNAAPRAAAGAAGAAGLGGATTRTGRGAAPIAGTPTGVEAPGGKDEREEMGESHGSVDGPSLLSCASSAAFSEVYARPASSFSETSRSMTARDASSILMNFTPMPDGFSLVAFEGSRFHTTRPTPASTFSWPAR
ncbi:MAG: hypothetical protein FWD73_15850 [Polyangiaceae bacterium]|nr:hypothetical protein [Polyangiaceae bacterium]